MIKFRITVEHRSLHASEFFSTEIYGVPACFAVNYTDAMYHGTKSSIQDRLQTRELPNYNQNNLRALITEASPLQVYLLKLFMTSKLYSTKMLID